MNEETSPLRLQRSQACVLCQVSNELHNFDYIVLVQDAQVSMQKKKHKSAHARFHHELSVKSDILSHLACTCLLLMCTRSTFLDGRFDVRYLISQKLLAVFCSAPSIYLVRVDLRALWVSGSIRLAI